MEQVQEYTTMQVRAALGDVLDRARLIGEHAAITRKGKTLAYLVPAEWYERARAAIGDPSDTKEE